MDKIRTEMVCCYEFDFGVDVGGAQPWCEFDRFYWGTWTGVSVFGLRGDGVYGATCE